MRNRLVAAVLAVAPLAAHGSPFVYVANTRDATDDVTVIDLDGDTVEVALVQGNTFPRAVAVTPDGTSLFVTTEIGSIERYAASELLHTWNAWLDLDPLDQGGGPRGMAVSSDGSRVYVAMQWVPQFAVVENTTPMSFRMYPLSTAGGAFAEVDPDDEWLYIAHNDGTLSFVDLTTLDPVAGTVSVTTRTAAIGAPGGTSMLGGAFVVSDAVNSKVRTYFSRTAYQDNLVHRNIGAVVSYMDVNGARYTMTSPLLDELYSLTFGARSSGGSGPSDVGWSDVQRVEVVTNFGSDNVVVMRSPSPVTITDPSLSEPADLVVGPQLEPAPEPRSRPFSFDYKDCNETITQIAKITNVGPGYLDFQKIKLTGSKGYTIREDLCSGRRILPKKLCTVEYRLNVKAEYGTKGIFKATATLPYNGGLVTHELAAKPLVKACQ